MPIVPYLVLDEESTILLCAPRTGNRDLPQVESPSDEQGVDAVQDCSFDDDDDDHVNDDSSSSCSIPISVDVESQVECFQVELESGLMADHSDSDGSLCCLPGDAQANAEVYVSQDDSLDTSSRQEPAAATVGGSRAGNRLKGAEDVVNKAMRGTEIVVNKAVRGTEIVVNKAVRGTEIAVNKAVKGTEIAVNKAVKGTEIAVNKAVKHTEKAVKTTAKSTEKVVKKTTDEIINLPREATSHWSHLTALLLILAILPVFLSTPNFLPKQNSVNLGLEHNRGFLYGTHTIVEVFMHAAIISACHYATDHVEIPLAARVLANVIGLVVGKVALMLIAEAWWTPNLGKAFPVPFSFIVTTVAASPFVLGTLRLMSPKQTDPVQDLNARVKFRWLFGTISAYIGSLLVACVWGIVFRYLELQPQLQSIWVFASILLEILCKILVTANLTTRLNPKKWIQLDLVVDLIFASVQTALSPFYANWYSVALSVFGTIGAIAFRAYGAGDRIVLFCSLLWKTFRQSSSGPINKVKQVRRAGMRIVRESTPNIHSMSLSFRLAGNGPLIDRISKWDEEESHDDNDKSLERAETAETESLEEDCCKSSDSESGEELNGLSCEGPATPDTVNTSDESVLAMEGGRMLFSDSEEPPPSASQRNGEHLIQTDGRQRHCFHIVDSVASAVINIEIRLAGLLTMTAIRAYAVREHLNESFQLDDRVFTLSAVYNSIFIVANILVILGVGVYIKRGLKLGGLTLNRVISFIFRDSFWFIFFWLCLQQQLTIAIYFNHYGADFSMKFVWLTCREPGLMQYPGCK